MCKANKMCHSVPGQCSVYSGVLLFETNNVHAIKGQNVHYCL